MRGAAQAKAVGEKAGPIIARAQVPFGETVAPQILRAFFTVRVMGVAPEPRGQGPVMIVRGLDARHALVLLALCGEEPFEGRTGQFARIPRMIRANLRIAHGGQRNRGTGKNRQAANHSAHRFDHHRSLD